MHVIVFNVFYRSDIAGQIVKLSGQVPSIPVFVIHDMDGMKALEHVKKYFEDHNKGELPFKRDDLRLVESDEDQKIFVIDEKNRNLVGYFVRIEFREPVQALFSGRG